MEVADDTMLLVQTRRRSFSVPCQTSRSWMQTAAKHGSHRSKQGRGGPHTPDSGSTRLRASRTDETEVDTGRRHGSSQCWRFSSQQQQQPHGGQANMTPQQPAASGFMSPPGLGAA
jgi:hypothetical protein